MAQVAPLERINSHSAQTEEPGTDETDNVTAIELQRNRRILYFSDGTMEESSDSDENDTTDRGLELHLDENELPLVARVKHRATKVGASLLAGIDYVGGGLASFFGITSPKYERDLDYIEQNYRKRGEEEMNDATWLNSERTSAAEIITRDINRNNVR